MENTAESSSKAEEIEEPSSPTEKDDGKQSNSDAKVEILFKATGNAPILKKKKWTVSQARRIGWINTFLRKLLKINTSESLFLYVNQAFAPSPDQTVENLYSCYGVDGSLLIHYCKSQAWG